MNIIDAPGLTDSDIPASIYIKALSLEGYVLTEELRERALESLRLSSTPGTTVYTGPGAVAYWSACSTAVRVCLVPGSQEIPQAKRAGSLLEWFLLRRGVPLTEARVLVQKPPTAQHQHFLRFVAAKQDEEEWSSLEWPEPEWEELEYVGGEPPVLRQPYRVMLVVDLKAYAALAKELEEAKRTGLVVGLDVETDEEENYESTLVGVGFSFGPRCYYLPMAGPLGEEMALALLRQHFLGKAPRFIGHNVKFDLQSIARALAPNDAPRTMRALSAYLAGDGLIALYCLGLMDYGTGMPLPKGLKPATLRYFGVQNLTFKEMLGLSGANKASEAPVGDIGPYCCADAYWGVRVEEAARKDLAKKGRLLELYEKMELPTVPVLAEMELLGLPLDKALLRKRLKEFEEKCEVLRKYLEQTAVGAGYVLKTEPKRCAEHKTRRPKCEACQIRYSVPFNPNSDDQLSAVVQGTFGLPRFASTPGGKASNNAVALLQIREWAQDEDAKDWITFYLAWAKAEKVRGTYLAGLSKRARDEDLERGFQEGYFVHPTFNQDIVVTGRLSSKDPNAQNIPLNQRDLFIGPYWNADYSQLELRILAFASKCSAMIETFLDPNGDIHAQTTWRVFGVHPKDQTPTLRTRGKTLNFGMGYGAQGETVQEQIMKVALERPELNIAVPSLTECKEMVKMFWRAYPETAEWVAFIHELTRDRGYSETLYGRREYFPFARSPNAELRARVDRQAVNMIIQGTAGDLIKLAARMLWEKAPEYGADIRTQVHDELMGRVYDMSKADSWLELVERYMKLDQPLSPVPLKVEPKLVKTWKDAK